MIFNLKPPRNYFSGVSLSVQEFQLIGVWLFTKLTFVLILFYFHSPKFSVEQTLLQWDAQWYLQIAEKGYIFASIQDFSPVAFMPGYPLLAKLINLLVNNYFYSLLMITTLSSLLAVILLYKLLINDFDQKTAYYSVLLLLVSPLSLVFSIPYTEALFLFLSVIFFLLLSKNKFWWAAFTLNLLMITRNVGVIYLVPLIYILIKKRMILSYRGFGAILLSLVSLVALMIYSYQSFSRGLIFLQAHTAWNRIWQPFPMMIINQFRQLFNIYIEYGWTAIFHPEWLWMHYPIIIDGFLIVLSVVLLIKDRLLLPSIYRWFALIYVFIVLSYPPALNDQNYIPPTLSAVRALTICFPVFVLIYKRCHQKIIPLLIFSFILHTGYLALYVNHFYIP